MGGSNYQFARPACTAATLIAEQGPGGSQVAGVTAKSPAGDNAERLHAEGICYLGHQPVEFQSSGLRVFLELRTQQDIATESRQMVCGHGEVAGPGAPAMAQRAINIAITLRPPAAKYRGRAWQDCSAHMRLALFSIHLRPGQRLAIGSRGAHPLGIASGAYQDRQAKQHADASSFSKLAHGIVLL
jgi:hypothetical protein